MMNIVLFGPPGGGKGTQSALIKQKYRLIPIAPGCLLREQVSKKTALGQRVAQYIDRGELAPDALVLDVVSEQLVATPGAPGFLFDGFPRTVAQAQTLEENLVRQGAQLDAVIFLEVPEPELIERIRHRAQIAGRVDDQDEASIATRMRIYHEDTLPVAQYYANQNKLFRVCGVGAIDVIFTRIEAVLARLSNLLMLK